MLAVIPAIKSFKNRIKGISIVVKEEKTIQEHFETLKNGILSTKWHPLDILRSEEEALIEYMNIRITKEKIGITMECPISLINRKEDDFWDICGKNTPVESNIEKAKSGSYSVGAYIEITTKNKEITINSNEILYEQMNKHMEPKFSVMNVLLMLLHRLAITEEGYISYTKDNVMLFTYESYFKSSMSYFCHESFDTEPKSLIETIHNLDFEDTYDSQNFNNVLMMKMNGLISDEDMRAYILKSEDKDSPTMKRLKQIMM